MKNKDRKSLIPAAALILILLLTGMMLRAQGGQWRGPNRDGKYPDTGLLKSWPAGGPELLLKIEGLGNGHSSAVVVDEKIYVSGKRKDRDVLTKLDMQEGSLLWESEPQGGVRSYVSPLLVNHNGTRMILITTSEDIMAVDPETGEVFWNIDLAREYGNDGRRNNTNTPLYHRGEIFTTSGYDAQGVMIRLSEDGKSAEVKWHNNILDVHHGGAVEVDGHLYGANFINPGRGYWVCLEWDTGKVKWVENWHNKGSIIYADGLLYLFEEQQGHIGLLEPSPEEFKLISSFRLESRSGPYWAHPAIYDKKLFVRHGTVLYVYDIGA